MREIVLTRGFVALVDDEDYQWATQFNWQAVSFHSKDRHYAQRGLTIAKNRRGIRRMHREIAARVFGDDKIAGKEIDHINRNPLDNRRSNLRLSTRGENSRNIGVRKDSTSGFKGVCWNRHYRKWTPQLWVGGKRIYIGYYDSAQAAARAYDDAAKRHHGEFAALNFPAETKCAFS